MSHRNRTSSEEKRKRPISALNKNPDFLSFSLKPKKPNKNPTPKTSTLEALHNIVLTTTSNIPLNAKSRKHSMQLESVRLDLILRKGFMMIISKSRVK